jgi:hypothetical protein
MKGKNERSAKGEGKSKMHGKEINPRGKSDA